jgi:hypothetical protein
MKVFGSRIFWGILLILGGAALLLENLGIFRLGGLVWGIVLGIGGIVFLFLYFENREAWWPLIPGITLLSICAASLLDVFVPELGQIVSGLIILGGIGLSFFLIYLIDRENWWAIIPAGVLVTLGVISVIDAADFHVDTGGYFFIGIGLTFFLVAVLPNPQGQMKWAFIPALALIGIGVFILSAVNEIWYVLWPLLIIAGGGYLVYKTITSSRSRK